MFAVPTGLGPLQISLHILLLLLEFPRRRGRRVVRFAGYMIVILGGLVGNEVPLTEAILVLLHVFGVDVVAFHEVHVEIEEGIEVTRLVPLALIFLDVISLDGLVQGVRLLRVRVRELRFVYVILIGGL